jgi:hypothetical protein
MRETDMVRGYYHLQNWNFSASLHGENEGWGRQKRKELKRVENTKQGRVR